MASRSRSTRRLGRGLASLMSTPAEIPGPAAPEPSASQADAPSPEQPPADAEPGAASDPALRRIPVDRIQPNPHQPRRSFDEQALRELADSILSAGLIQPIVVRASRGATGVYELIAGERRWRAARLAGLEAIPAVLRDTSDQQSAEFALIENLQRADLNPIERAEGLQSLCDRFGLTQSALAQRVGMPRPSIANLLRLLQLPESVRELLRSGDLTLGHGKLLVGLSDNQLIEQLAGRCARAGWSVRKLEEELKRVGGEAPAPARHAAPPRPPHVLNLEQQLSSHLGTKVKIREGRTKGSGSLVIEFYDLDQFDGLMQRMGFEQS